MNQRLIYNYNPIGAGPMPKWFSNQSLILFVVVFAACLAFFGHAMELQFAIVSILSVFIFFLGGQRWSAELSRKSEKIFLKNIFWIGFALRFAWVCYCYFYFNEAQYGNVHGDDADTGWYMDFAKNLVDWIKGGFVDSFDTVQKRNGSVLDDTGYPIYLALIYLITGVENDLFIPLLLKCVWGAWCAYFIYQTAKRHYGDYVARMAALFVALNPNMIYWCGTMMKETEMVFMCCLFVNEMDKALGNNARLTFKALLPAISIGLTFFLLRSALGLVAFAAVMAHVVFASQRIISMGKKVIAGVLVAFVLLVGMGQGFRDRVTNVVESVQSDSQKTNMEWRSNRKDAAGRSNSFAKYAGAAVFAPMIFTIPFPTFNAANEGQVTQMQLSGGSYIKNMVSFFCIFALFIMLFSGEWRRHVFIIAYTCGYLACLVLSSFAQSGRFHMPALPFIMLFGAYGLSIVQQNKKWKKYWPMLMAAEFVICLGWNWFKLKGRGMI